jgi:hypothetical protein
MTTRISVRWCLSSIGATAIAFSTVAACSGGSDLSFGSFDGSDDDDGSVPKRDGSVVSFDGTTKVDAQKKDVFIPPDPEDDAGTCKKSGVTFIPPTFKSSAAKTTACNDTQISAISTACYKAPESAGCATVRNEAANKTCGDCMFGQKTDSIWKMVILDPGGTPPARLNQAGCVNLTSGVAKCGESYLTIVACFDAFCADCPTAAEETACDKEVGNGPGSQECKQYLISDAKCADALQSDAVGKCFPGGTSDADLKAVFTHMAGVFCK